MIPLDQAAIAELSERSKDDRAFIAGSEVRALCATAEHYRAEAARLRDSYHNRTAQHPRHGGVKP